MRGGDGLATLGAAAVDHGPAGGRGHTGAKTVFFVSAAVVGLIRAFGHEELLVFNDRTLGPVKAEDFKASLWTGSSKKLHLEQLIHRAGALRAD
jgi:hypothetical protein